MLAIFLDLPGLLQFEMDQWLLSRHAAGITLFFQQPPAQLRRPTAEQLRVCTMVN